MNLLTLSQKRVIPENTVASGVSDYTRFFGYDKRVATSHLDARTFITSDIPGNDTVEMSVIDILNDKRG